MELLSSGIFSANSASRFSLSRDRRNNSTSFFPDLTPLGSFGLGGFTLDVTLGSAWLTSTFF